MTLEYFDDVVQHAKVDRKLSSDLLQEVRAVLGRNLEMGGVLLREATAEGVRNALRRT